MSYLVIAEKEEAGRKIAQVLGATNEKTFSVTVNKKSFNIPVYYGGSCIVISARGHLIEPKLKGLKTAKLRDLPIFDVYYDEVNDEARARLKIMKEIHDKVSNVIIATDYDREGEAIGFNIVRYKLKRGYYDFFRAYFSALTDKFILDAFTNLQRMNERLLVQGLARGLADVILNLNITKALTLRLKNIYPDVVQALSLGRVQSPLLNYINDNFNPEIAITFKGGILEREERNEEKERIVIINWKDYAIKLDESLLKKDTTELKVTEVKEDISEEVQSILLDNTNDIMNALSKQINPEELMQLLERMYLKGLITYPRTESRGIDEDTANYLFNELKKWITLRDTWKVENSIALKEPLKDGKLAITLTPEGIEKYYTNQLTKAEKLIATYLLEKLVITFAPKLRKKSITLRLEDVYDQENYFYYSWSTTIENLEDSVYYKYSLVRDIPAVDDKFGVDVIYVETKDKYISRYNPSAITKTDTKIMKDSELVRYLINENLGTEATRHTYPGLLRTRHYTTISNIPTLLGEKIANIIKKIGLTSSLTAMIENEISELQDLYNLEDFKQNIRKVTIHFVDKLKELPDDDFIFKCPKLHEMKLTQYKGKEGVIVGICDTCNKKIPLF